MLGAGTLLRFTALVDYYGGNTMVTWGEDRGPTPFERIKNIKALVIGFFGNAEANPSPAGVAKIKAEFNKHAIRWNSMATTEPTTHFKTSKSSSLPRARRD